MKKAFIITGLQNGDESKGAIVDFLTRKYNSKLIIRYSGGAQAAHNVVLPSGEHHTFSQFGSGTLAGAFTYLSEYMLVEPLAMMNEADHLEELGIVCPFLKVLIDENATVITPYHILANKIKETYRGKNKHGSCGMGCGETMQDKLNGHEIKIKDLKGLDIGGKLFDVINLKTRELKEYLNNDTKEMYDKFLDMQFFLEIVIKYQKFLKVAQICNKDDIRKKLKKDINIIFEGSQGMLLDEKYGFAPYNTWSDLSYNNALNIVKDCDYQGDIVKLGLTRSYMTRHGAGPFPTEDESLRPKVIDGEHNKLNPWQQQFRVGHLDLVMLKYSVKNLGGIDYLVINHCDKIQTKNKVCIGYSNIMDKFYSNGELIYQNDETEQFSLTNILNNARTLYVSLLDNDFEPFIKNQLNIKIGILGFGPTYEDKDLLNEL